jgi:hypothetical protein
VLDNHQLCEVLHESLAKPVNSPRLSARILCACLLILQIGHAIWIGNLPPQTELMALVFHVCREAPGLESLFLISKSNCAFANFKDEATCTAAQVKIHDSRFQSIKLVSRLRRSSVGSAAGLAAPTGPAALSPPSNPVVARTPSPDSTDTSSKVPLQDGDIDSRTEEPSPVKDKYFIVKSLTVEDLELSVRNGIWATQSHNEQALNKAYQVSKRCHLGFEDVPKLTHATVN